ncbi:MAG: nitrous oxide reductase accessory protein NosL [Candidatus Kapabacteria bacterium]|nr:nitrous oxide reductase accessory protein NosL [Candidatus Kapabacteria bacterium]
MSSKVYRLILIVFGSIYLGACSPSPVPIDYGKDECSNCKMQLSDKKFGAEILTKTSKHYIFDSIECMSIYLTTNNIDKNEIHSLWVIDYSNPANLINAKEASFLKCNGVPSPMGLSLSAFSNLEKIKSLPNCNDGVIVKWEEVTILVQKEWRN